MEKKFTTDNFELEVLKADKPVLVDFYADWCGPCKMMAPLVEELAKEYEGKAIVGKLNIDEFDTVAARYQVMNIPTLAIFKGGELVDKLIGVHSREEVKAMLDRA